MVKLKYVIIAILGVLIVIVSALYLFQSEERRIKKRFDLLAELASKEPGETAFTLAYKVQRIGTLFSDACEVRVPSQSISGRYTPEEISSHAAGARLPLSELSLQFYDLDIEFPEEGMATVLLTGRLTGESKAGETIHETRELQCILREIGGEWLFSHLEVVDVLKK